jgi:hypothetical protein
LKRLSPNTLEKATEETKRGEDASNFGNSPMPVGRERINQDLELSFNKIETIDVRRSREF